MKSDPQKIEAHTYRREGKKLAAELFANPNFDLKTALHKIPGKQRQWAREGMFEALMANIGLSSREGAMDIWPAISKGVLGLTRNNSTARAALDSIAQHIQRYGDEQRTLIERLRAHFEQVAKQRSDQVAQQTGAHISLDPASLPEFQQALRQNMAQLERHYQIALDQAKNHLRAMFARSK